MVDISLTYIQFREIRAAFAHRSLRSGALNISKDDITIMDELDRIDAAYSRQITSGTPIILRVEA